ncbi:N-acetylglucosamine-6-phosphate deacetylase [Mycoplasmopsis cricetuli]|uniref:N-acetylglucosamine-6-phosphate deacetylase n=1 Tax=Mycoplasmopsis cricetuli TaxID=171283 RepID=UPI000470229E|nr:N-acetylglucosamine-6-phosphate deacetylase [Mycoplasmopsis cricetuli]
MIIKNVSVVNYNEIINNADVHIKDGKILKIIRKTGFSKKYLLPGFIDTHIHGFKNKDFKDSTEACQQILDELAHEGITAVMPTLMTDSWEKILQALENTSKANSYGSRILGIHLEGPFISEDKKGAHKSEFLTAASIEKINQLHQASNYMLKKISFDPKQVSLEVVEHMASLKITPFIGHSNVSFEVAQQYFNSKVKGVCHMWNAMSGIDSRNPGLLQAAFLNDVYTEVIIDLMHISKPSVEFTLKNKNLSKIICISDAIKPAYAPDGDYESGSLPITKKGFKITLKNTETIAGSAITIYDSFKHLIKLNLDLKDIVKLTSYNAARSLQMKKLGIIKPNYWADLVLIDKKSLNLDAVILNGKLIKGKLK